MAAEAAPPVVALLVALVGARVGRVLREGEVVVRVDEAGREHGVRADDSRRARCARGRTAITADALDRATRSDEDLTAAQHLPGTQDVGRDEQRARARCHRAAAIGIRGQRRAGAGRDDGAGIGHATVPAPAIPATPIAWPAVREHAEVDAAVRNGPAPVVIPAADRHDAHAERPDPPRTPTKLERTHHASILRKSRHVMRDGTRWVKRRAGDPAAATLELRRAKP
jgi:hypothetical protein